MVTQFVDSLHRRYSGIKIQPISNYENEDLAFEIAIPRKAPSYRRDDRQDVLVPALIEPTQVF
jgi:hypothetical protein